MHGHVEAASDNRLRNVSYLCLATAKACCSRLKHHARGYSFIYRSLGFLLWIRWLAPAAHGEPLPGRASD